MRLKRCGSHIRAISLFDKEALESILRTLGKAAWDAEQRISNAVGTYEGECIGEVIGEENLFIDDLLGCAFVAAQSYITRVTSRLEALHKHAKREGHCLKTTNGSKEGLRKACSNTVGGTPYTEIQVINAFANYFKHHEEWPPKWKNATRRNVQETIRVIQAVGVTKNASDNYRKGLAALGIHRVFDVYTIADILAQWQAKLADAYRQERKTAGFP